MTSTKEESETWAVKQAPRKLNPRHRLIAKMAVLGKNQTEIARELHMSATRVNTVFQSSLCQEQVDRERTELFKDPEACFREAFPEAIKTNLELMRNPETNASTRAAIAMDFMSRFCGKPTQKIESKTSMVGEIWHMLNKMDSDDRPSNPNSEIDVWVDENIIKAQAQTEALPETSDHEEASPVSSNIDGWVAENVVPGGKRGL